jgi:hypothetical protein
LGFSEQFENSEKSFIDLDLGIFIDFQAAFFEHLKVVFRASRTSDRQNDAG